MKKVLSFVLAFAALFLFAGCDLLGGGNGGNGGDDDANKVTVSWYHGSQCLKEQKVEKGSKVTSWEPKAEGKTFTGWFSEASLTVEFDFEKEINEDTDIFAAFKSDEFVADENSYYLIGTGAGDMGKAAWDHAKAAAELSMERQDVAGANVYKIQITMYAGDAFQICFGGSWDGQVGIGKMVGAEYVDGTNRYDGTEYTAADKKVAAVKDAEGNVIFEGHDEYNKAYDVWNIFLAEGQDGVYEFTYTTYPNAKDYNTIEWRLVEKLDALTSTHEMYLIGAFNGWAERDTNWALKESDDKATWNGFLTVTPEMFVDYGQDDKNTTAIKVFNGVDGQYYPGGDNIFIGEGTWAVQYVVATNEVKVEKCEYYIVGTLLDGEGNAVNYAVKEGASPKLEKQEDGSYAAEFEAYDVTSLGDYSWMVDQGKTDPEGNAAIISIKVVFGSSLGIKDWYSAEGGDNWYLSAGTYNVVLAEGAVTVSAK